MTKFRYLCVAGFALAAIAGPAHAEPVFGLTRANTIVTFDSTTPGTITSTGSISGIASGDTLAGIDLRPANGLLYSVGTSGNLYVVTKDVSGTGYTASSVGILTTPPSSTSFGIDFNPTVDRLRFVSDTNQNLRINPNNPSLVGPPAGTINDGSITLNGSSTVDLVAAAYRNSFPGTSTTVLYGLDAVTDSLVRSTDANAGVYVNTSVLGNTFSPLGFSFAVADRVAFDIAGSNNQGFFTINDAFYTVDQITGLGAFVGNLGVTGITGIAVATVPEPATWGMMIIGFGAVGCGLRRRRALVAATA